MSVYRPYKRDIGHLQNSKIGGLTTWDQQNVFNLACNQLEEELEVELLSEDEDDEDAAALGFGFAFL